MLQMAEFSNAKYPWKKFGVASLETEISGRIVLFEYNERLSRLLILSKFWLFSNYLYRKKSSNSEGMSFKASLKKRISSKVGMSQKENNSSIVLTS